MTQFFDKEFDIIFAGGGTCACVTAGRLAAADPSLKILIIEAGRHTRNQAVVTQPARFWRNLITGGENLYQHVGNSSPSLGGRKPVIQGGKCIGGGSCVNFMMYTRPVASDYDDWEKLGNPGWGSKEVIPLSNKVETYEGAGRDEHHGHSGPIRISRGGIRLTIPQDFLDTAKIYDPGRGQTNDSNDFKTIDQYSHWDMYIDAKTGKRSDAAHHFIYNQDERNKNIQILTSHRIVRVIFENDRAVGVEYVDASSREQVLQAYATKLVVLSAGAFGSVAILERSGIGSREVLSKNGIEQRVDLPGVGENYNDHNLGSPIYYTTEEPVTHDAIFRGEEASIEVATAQWTQHGTGLIAHNSIAAAVKLRPHAKDLDELGPDFTETWQKCFENAPDKPVLCMCPATAAIGVYPETAKGKFFTTLYYTEYPQSIGRVHIQSATDPFKAMDFAPGYLDHVADVAVLRWAYKRGRELARRMQSYRGEVAPAHPKFSKGSNAVPVQAVGPVDYLAPDIVYTKDDDEKIDDYHRETVGTTWHSLGTCAMKPRELGGVVDPSLNVYGVRNLKVCDLSIAPLNVAANTYNTALMVGEKGALIIARELGIAEV